MLKKVFQMLLQGDGLSVHVDSHEREQPDWQGPQEPADPLEDEAQPEETVENEMNH
jgi:hypothetical protein